MDHIRQHDWCSFEPDVHFLNEIDLDNSVTERILRNRFHDPLISSDSEDEGPSNIKINWEEIFNKKVQEKHQPRVLVPGFHPLPPFPKVSSLTIQQHYQCLKVLCAEHPHILPAEFIPRPTKQDRKVFEELKEKYAKEQQEFIEWAKTLWTNSHCVRALRPKPPIEMVYEAEFKMTAHKMQSFPKNYALAAQIPLESANATCELVHEKDLINVPISAIPKMSIPDLSEKVFIMKPYPLPEPCSKHPCRFQLPGESAMTLLPLTEVHKELAQYAADNGAQFIASEEALTCLMEVDKSWLIPLSVCQVMGPDGALSVCALEAPCRGARAAAPERTRAAFHRLLEHCLAPPVDSTEKRKRSVSSSSPRKRPSVTRERTPSDDEDHPLFMDTDAFQDNPADSDDNPEDNMDLKKLQKSLSRNNSREENTTPKRNSTGHDAKNDFYNCTCNDTFDKPPQRSYMKWKVINRTSNDQYSMIVHCPHRVRVCNASAYPAGEVVVSPVAEFQADVAASRVSAPRRRAHALAVTLRREDANVLDVRIDSPSGEIISLQSVTLDELLLEDAGMAGDVTNRLHTALDQLQGLLPGQYILQHEPSHGDNAILYSAKPGASDLTLNLAAPAEADDAAAVKTPPALAPVLLPIHKYRKILPCAFTPFPQQLPKETRVKPPARQKTPPQAIKPGAPGDDRRSQWPKKKNKKKKKNNNRS